MASSSHSGAGQLSRSLVGRFLYLESFVKSDFNRPYFPSHNYDEVNLNITTQPLDGLTQSSDTESVSPPSKPFPPLQYIQYGHSILITGDTKPYKERLKGYGARWNGRLKGWILQQGYEQAFKAAFADLL